MNEESQELFSSLTEDDKLNEDELIEELLAEDNEITDQGSELNEKNTKLPLARIKTLMKMDPDLNLASQESVFLIARATELFLKHLAKETYQYTVKAKRKTVQKRDVLTAIENVDSLCFLEGAID